MPDNTVEIFVKIRDEASQALAQIQATAQTATQGLASSTQLGIRANQEAARATDVHSFAVREAARSIKFAGATIIGEYSPALADMAIRLNEAARLSSLMQDASGKLGLGLGAVAAIIGGAWLRAVDTAARQTGALNTAIAAMDVGGLRSKILGYAADLDIVAERTKTGGGQIIDMLGRISAAAGLTIRAEEAIKKTREAYERVAPIEDLRQRAVLQSQIARTQVEAATFSLVQIQQRGQAEAKIAAARSAFNREAKAQREALNQEEIIALANAQRIGEAEVGRTQGQYDLKKKALNEQLKTRGGALEQGFTQFTYENQLAFHEGVQQAILASAQARVRTQREAEHGAVVDLVDAQAEINTELRRQEFERLEDIKTVVAAEIAARTQSYREAEHGAQVTGEQVVGTIQRQFAETKKLYDQDVQDAIGAQLLKAGIYEDEARKQRDISLGVYAAVKADREQDLRHLEMIAAASSSAEEQIGAGAAAGFARVRDSLGTWGQNAEQVVQGVGQAMARGMDDFFFNAIEGRFKSLSDVAKQAGEAILREFTGVFGRMAASSLMDQLKGFLPLGNAPAGAGASLALVPGFGGTIQQLSQGQQQFANPMSLGSDATDLNQAWGESAWSPLTQAAGGGSNWMGMAGGGIAGALGIYAGYQAAANATGNTARVLGVLGSTASGALAGAQIGGPWAAVIGGVIGLSVGLVGALQGHSEHKTVLGIDVKTSKDDREGYDKINAMSQADLQAYAEELAQGSDPLAAFLAATGRDPRDRNVVRASQLLSEFIWPQIEGNFQATGASPGGFLFQEAFAPGITRYEALAGTGPRQRAQAISALRRGTVDVILQGMDDNQVEQLIARIRSVAELRAIPILPQRRFVEVLG